MQVAATLIDAKTGKVTAQIGGRNIEEGTRLGDNLAVNTKRDVGSTVKPITDYAPAFEYLDVSTGKTIVDEPYKYVGTNTPVRNWDNKYWGTMTLRTALIESRNVPAVKLFNEVGADKIEDFLSRLGIQYAEIQQANAISSNTVDQDGTKYGMSSLKLAAAYAALSNGGTYNEPQYVNKIVFADGSEEVEAFKTPGIKAMEETTAYMVTDILKGVIESGPGYNATIQGLYQAGKTGTSNYTEEELEALNAASTVFPDSTFVGYTVNYSLAVWTGYRDQKTPITNEYSGVASDVYREVMQHVSASVVNEDWVMPKGLTRIGRELYLEGQYVAPPVAPPVESKPAESSSESSESSSSSTTSSSESTTPSSSSSETTPPAVSTQPPAVEPTPTPSTEEVPPSVPETPVSPETPATP